MSLFGMKYTDHNELRNTWFMPLRLVVFLVVFGSIVVSFRNHFDLYIPFVAYSLITLLFLASMSFGRKLSLSGLTSPLIALQLVSELILESFIVYNSGNLSSPFSGLFILTIVSAALAYRLVGTLLIATVAAMSFAAAVWFGAGAELTKTFSLESVRSLYVSNDDVFYTIFIHLCIFYLSAFISGYLAERIRVKDRELLNASESLKRVRLETDEILKHLNSGLITLDNYGRIVYFNRSAEKITGFRESDIKGRGCLEVFQKRMPQFAEKILSVLKSSEHDIRSEITMTTDSGNSVPIGMSTSILGDVDTGIRGVVTVFQDLTLAKEVEQKIRRADRLAAVGELASAIAHEIRNPLAAISGSVEILKENISMEGENERLMTLMLKESARLNNILGEFLEYARVKRPTFAKVEINHLVLEVFDIARHHNSYHKNISLEHNSENTTEYISGDEEMFKQFLLNLVVNSVQAIGENRGRVVVEVGSHTDITPTRTQDTYSDFEWVKMTITDDGPGFPIDQRDRVFEPFFSTKKDGTGLGLSIVRRIVESLGGLIEVESTAHSGTIFTIYLRRFIEGLPQPGTDPDIRNKAMAAVIPVHDLTPTEH